MKKRQKGAKGAFGAVVDLVKAVPELDEATKDSNARATLVQVVDELDGLSVEQDPSRAERMGITGRLTMDMRKLRLGHIRPIVRIGRAKAEEVPEIGKLRTPPANIDAAALVTAADEVAKRATPYKDLFVVAGLKPDFLDRLDEATKAVQGGVSLRSDGKGRRESATTGVAATVKKGMLALGVIDALVVPVAEAHSEALLKRWRITKKVAAGAAAAQAATSKPAATPAVTPPVAGE